MSLRSKSSDSVAFTSRFTVLVYNNCCDKYFQLFLVSVIPSCQKIDISKSGWDDLSLLKKLKMGDPGISVFEELNIQAEEKIETLLSSFQVNKGFCIC
jgi:hypothetical protein